MGGFSKSSAALCPYDKDHNSHKYRHAACVRGGVVGVRRFGHMSCFSRRFELRFSFCLLTCGLRHCECRVQLKPEILNPTNTTPSLE